MSIQESHHSIDLNHRSNIGQAPSDSRLVDHLSSPLVIVKLVSDQQSIGLSDYQNLPTPQDPIPNPGKEVRGFNKQLKARVQDIVPQQELLPGLNDYNCGDDDPDDESESEQVENEEFSDNDASDDAPEDVAEDMPDHENYT
jgi:hypothetical protein